MNTKQLIQEATLARDKAKAAWVAAGSPRDSGEKMYRIPFALLLFFKQN